jgi:hypothetical protein
MREFCGKPASLAGLLIKSAGFSVEREELFHKYGKAGDPISDDVKWGRFVKEIDAGHFDLASWKKSKLVSGQDDFDRLAVDISAYWIYRVRSSIAHNRVGEYLLQDKHTIFLRDFAEPLLLETVSQIFSSPKLKQIM